MLKYKILERKYALRQEETDLVMTCKLKQEEGMQLIHKYMEHRKFAIQTEALFEKMAIHIFLSVPLVCHSKVKAEKKEDHTFREKDRHQYQERATFNLSVFYINKYT
ncbi:leucine-rich repeat and IQ domain-containing protein 3 [Acipenser oxyrinchus oxyrinchus]|uniref:Leucine-rich repeat and IQ domain-containing protein 3 n=1 Tax=Acipenser oxyrinchus oxyrinchus TaxID=40147 RepID=A0AAD8D9W8_ACIOX|nr:leucine-rich repeat and IQ domain-containing protein 3 [Acipenser oxyrinchus oxyrinchus]